MVLYKCVCQRAFHDAENVYNFVVGSFVKRTPDLLSSIQTSSKFKVYIFAKNLHHFYSFGHRMLVSSTVQSKPGVKHVKQIKILLKKPNRLYFSRRISRKSRDCGPGVETYG